MHAKAQGSSVLIAVLVAALSACSPDTPEAPAQAMPAVNDENCKPEVIRTIEDKGRREQFASLCLRRGPRFKASENKAW
jgi:entry exclusion lipoprotein TrbK